MMFQSEYKQSNPFETFWVMFFGVNFGKYLTYFNYFENGIHILKSPRYLARFDLLKYISILTVWHKKNVSIWTYYGWHLCYHCDKCTQMLWKNKDSWQVNIILIKCTIRHQYDSLLLSWNNNAVIIQSKMNLSFSSSWSFFTYFASRQVYYTLYYLHMFFHSNIGCSY